MSRFVSRISLACVLSLAVSAPARAAEEDDGDLFDDDDAKKDDDDKKKDDGKAPDPNDPNIKRVDEDDVESWSLEGEKKPEETKKPEELKKKELPPEPKRVGTSGNWYEISIECVGCPTLRGQTFNIEDPLVMREFFDYLQVDEGRRSGKFVFPSIGQNRPLGIKESGSRLLIWQYVIDTGTRLTDTYATLWDLSVKANGGLLYGRKYEVQAWTADAYVDWEKGYKANDKFIPVEKLSTYFDLGPIKQLDTDKKNFQVGESARVAFVGYSAFARSDVSRDAIEAEQAALEAQAEAEAKKLRDQQDSFKQGEKALDDNDYEGALAAFQQARTLGLDDVDLAYNLGFTYQRLERFPDAVKEYGKVLQADPRDLDVRYNLARVYEKLKDFDSAIREYQTILKFDPDDKSAADRLELLRAARDMIGK